MQEKEESERERAQYVDYITVVPQIIKKPDRESLDGSSILTDMMLDDVTYRRFGR